MGIKETNKARKAVSGMFSTTAGVNRESKSVISEPTNSVIKPETALSAELPDLSEPESTNSVTPVEIPVVTPKKKGRPKVTRETKQRYAITLLPSLYAKAGEKAAEQGRSLSEVIGRYIEQYVKED
jgi:hypothetical protein